MRGGGKAITRSNGRGGEEGKGNFLPPENESRSPSSLAIGRVFLATRQLRGDPGDHAHVPTRITDRVSDRRRRGGRRSKLAREVAIRPGARWGESGIGVAAIIFYRGCIKCKVRRRRDYSVKKGINSFVFCGLERVPARARAPSDSLYIIPFVTDQS